MDHEFTPEQELFRSTVREFCEKEISREYVRECDRERRAPREVYEKLAAQGWLGVNTAEEHGGAGAGAVEVAILLEELGRAFLDLSFWVFRTVTWGGLAIGRDGTPEQKADLLPRIVSGKLAVCFSLTEPDAGSDAAAIALSAVEDGEELVLNGQKVFTSGFKVSDLDIVAARTSSGEQKHHGITNFIVDTDSPGLEWQPIETLGHWPLGTAMLYFTDVRVPKTRMLGRLDEGWPDLGVYLRYERLCLSAARTGAAAAALADSVAYALEREQFGRPIGEFQLVQGMLAEMVTLVRASRLLCRDAAAALDAGRTARLECAIAKKFCTESAHRVASLALQVHGGSGYSTDLPLERIFRDTRGGLIPEGTSEIQILIIGRELLGLFDLEDWRDELVESYSHGMRQKLIISSAFVHRPDVIVVDEPMVGLDPKAARILKDLFREYTHRGHTIMMSTHTLEVAQAMCDRIAIIRRGRIAAAGTIDELRRHAESGTDGLEDIFLRLTGETAARDLVEVLDA